MSKIFEKAELIKMFSEPYDEVVQVTEDTKVNKTVVEPEIVEGETIQPPTTDSQELDNNTPAEVNTPKVKESQSTEQNVTVATVNIDEIINKLRLELYEELESIKIRVTGIEESFTILDVNPVLPVTDTTPKRTMADYINRI